MFDPLYHAIDDVDETQSVSSKPSANFSNICRDSCDYAMEVSSRNRQRNVDCLSEDWPPFSHIFSPASASHTTFFSPVTQSDRPRWLHKQCAWGCDAWDNYPIAWITYLKYMNHHESRTIVKIKMNRNNRYIPLLHWSMDSHVESPSKAPPPARSNSGDNVRCGWSRPTSRTTSRAKMGSRTPASCLLVLTGA